jgi:hypothetical protein
VVNPALALVFDVAVIVSVLFVGSDFWQNT